MKAKHFDNFTGVNSSLDQVIGDVNESVPENDTATLDPGY